MMNRPLSFFFFALQIVQSSVLAESSGIAASTLFTFPEIHADNAESSCPVTDCPPCADRCDHVPSPDHLIGSFETTLTTPTSGTDTSRPPLRPFVFSGLGGSMMNRPLSFFFFALQIVQSSNLIVLGPTTDFCCCYLAHCVLLHLVLPC
uniref:Putative secreted protein n=1 Tax=Ixodes ricinus TaxID=34613 RepID=A0A147BEX9_IXORI